MKALLFSITAMCAALQTMGQSATKTKDGAQLILDNEKVKVFAYDGGSGKDLCGAGKHSHPAHLTVMLTDATIMITNANGEVKTAKLTAGTSFWSEAETHTVINSGANLVKCQIVELKKPKL